MEFARVKLAGRNYKELEEICDQIKEIAKKYGVSTRHEHSAVRILAALLLDGLLFFVVPGLVAFAVDFVSGAIYLPDDVERGEGPFIRDAPKVEIVE